MWEEIYREMNLEGDYANGKMVYIKHEFMRLDTVNQYVFMDTMWMN